MAKIKANKFFILCFWLGLFVLFKKQIISFLLTISPFAFIVGLVCSVIAIFKPSVLSNLFKRDLSKTQLLSAFITVTIISLILMGQPNNKTVDKNANSLPSSTEQSIIVTENEREIFYKYFEHYHNLPIGPIGDKSKHSKAISLTADEFHITPDEAEKIYEKVSNAKPSKKEIEIYETFETKLDEAIDNALSAESIDEESVKNKIAKQYGISTTKLEAIYTLVLSNTEYQEQRKNKTTQENKEKQVENIAENKKQILKDYIKKLNDVEMNQFIESVNYKPSSVEECSIVIKVRNTWHYQVKQIRLQAAQNLWGLWSQGYYLENEKDKCRLELVDLNGNNVGGSSWLGGSLINVKD